MVASSSDNGVQIIDITDPADPMSIANITDGENGFDELLGAHSVTTTEIDGKHYALVASSSDNGVQIIDITDPADPMSIANITDGENGFDELLGARSVTTTEIDGKHYALVASSGDNGVQIIDITNPAKPFNPLLPFIELDTTPPAHAVYKELTDEAMIFEYDVRSGDYSPDLAYTGPNAFHLNFNTLAYSNGTSFPTTLPRPGDIGSLSYSKDIQIGSGSPVNPVTPVNPNAAPYVVSIKTGGLDTIVITMSENVRGGDTGFTISGIKSNPSIDRVALSNHIITLTLSDDMDDSDSPRVIYDSSKGNITDDDDRPLANFDRAVRNTLDTTAPMVRSVTIDNSGTVFVRLSESVRKGLAEENDFVTNNSSITVSRISVSGSTITLELLGEIQDDAALTLNYTGSAGKFVDEAGNHLENFDKQINKQLRKRSSSSSTPAVDLASLQSLGYMDYNGTKAPHDPYTPIAPLNAGGSSGFALAINDMHYLLGGILSTLEPQTLLTGVDNTISFAVYDRADIVHFTLYMNLHGQDTDYQDSDTYVTYDMGNIRIVDPHDLISDATVSIKTSGADSLRHIVVFAITFEGEMEQTNLVARTWNTDASSTIVRILNAFAVSAAPPDTQPALSEDPVQEDPVSEDPVPDSAMNEPEESEPAGATPDPNAVKMMIRTWSGFEPGSVTDAQLLEALGLEHDGNIPSWVMTELGVLFSQDQITLEEFTAAISYVLANV